MKCLVTGGAGFIGSYLVEALVQRGDSVRVLDNFSTGTKSNLASVWSKIEFQKGDICKPAEVSKAVRGMEIVFHNAALRAVPRSVDDPLSTHNVNTTGTLHLLMACRKAKVQRVVYASSSSVYGDNLELPQKESLRASAVSPYAVSKLCGELYGIVYAKSFGLDSVALRYFNVYGPKQPPNSQYAAVVPQFMHWAYHGKPLEIHWDGKQSRDFTYIDDVVQANLLAASAPGVSGQVFNIACGETHSINDLKEMIERLIGHPLKIKTFEQRCADVRQTWADITEARTKLSYDPTVRFEEGLRRTWEWYVGTQTSKGKGRS